MLRGQLDSGAVIQATPGDIIMYPIRAKSSILDKLIGIAQEGLGRWGQQYYHCAIYAGEDNEYEATWPRTGLYAINYSRALEVWRPRDYNDFKRQEVLYACKLHCGEWYDVPAFLTVGLWQPFHLPVCSSFIAARFQEVGMCSRNSFEIPDELLNDIPSVLLFKQEGK